MSESETKLIAKFEKPPVLFHATQNFAIEVFEPRAEKTRDKKEGPRVFGTPSRALAGVFLIPTDDSWVQSGMMDDVPYIIIADEKRFRDLDHGGVVYSLPSNSFEMDPEKGLREMEWTSATSVKPIGKEVVPSALADMITHGVKVFFVNEDTFERIQAAPDYGRSIVENLTPYTG